MDSLVQDIANTLRTHIATLDGKIENPSWKILFMAACDSIFSLCTRELTREEVKSLEDQGYKSMYEQYEIIKGNGFSVHEWIEISYDLPVYLDEDNTLREGVKEEVLFTEITQRVAAILGFPISQ